MRIALAVLLLAACAAARADDLFGISMQLDGKREQKLAALDDLGVAWVRTTVIWERYEPSEGRFEWKWFDDIVADAEAHHLHLMVTILAISRWGSSALPDNYGHEGYQNVSPPKEVDAYARFVEALAARYKGRGLAWQFENEVNGKVFWSGSREEYLDLLKASYAAAHRGDPACTVLPAGLAGVFPNSNRLEGRLARHREWLDAILATKCFDAIDMHDYSPPEEGNPFGLTFEQYLEAYEGWLKEAGVKAPVWMSETGVNSAPIQVGEQRVVYTPEQQAKDLEQMYACARKHGIAHVFWLRLVDHEEAAFSFVGLAGEDRKPKPAAETYRRLAKGK